MLKMRTRGKKIESCTEEGEETIGGKRRSQPEKKETHEAKYNPITNNAIAQQQKPDTTVL